MALLSPTDFVGRYQIARNNVLDTRNGLLIDRLEKYYMAIIFGAELAEEVFSKIGSNGVINPDYADIYEPFIIQDECGKVYQSLGVQETLTGLIYLELIRMSKEEPSVIGGTVHPITENSEQMATSMNSVNNWNDAVMSMRAIQYRTHLLRSKYPTFKPSGLMLQSNF